MQPNVTLKFSWESRVEVGRKEKGEIWEREKRGVWTDL